MSADWATGRYKRGRGFRLSGMERGLLLGASAVGLFAAWHQALANTVSMSLGHLLIRHLLISC